MQANKTARFEAADPAEPLDPELLGLGDFEVRDPPYGLRLRCRVKRESPGFAEVTVLLAIPDRDSGKFAEVQLSQSVMDEALRSPGGPEVVRDLIRRAVLHELDETIYVAGVRAFDPHAGGPNAPSRF